MADYGYEGGVMNFSRAWWNKKTSRNKKKQVTTRKISQELLWMADYGHEVGVMNFSKAWWNKKNQVGTRTKQVTNRKTSYEPPLLGRLWSWRWGEIFQQRVMQQENQTKTRETKLKQEKKVTSQPCIAKCGGGGGVMNCSSTWWNNERQMEQRQTKTNKRKQPRATLYDHLLFLGSVAHESFPHLPPTTQTCPMEVNNNRNKRRRPKT